MTRKVNCSVMQGPCFPAQLEQRGATLVVTMIMLVLITILGFGAMQTSTMQERMSGNLRDKNISFQAAEAGLRDREGWLLSLRKLPNSIDSSPVEYGTESTVNLSGVLSDPMALVEEKYFIPDSLDIGFEPKKGRDLYRVESRGGGQTEYSETALETIYAKRFH